MINDQQFIDLIEKNPVIWNRKSKEFRNLNHRLETWERLATLTGTNSITVQKRWKSLREKYVRERKYWTNLKNRPGVKMVKQKWELCEKMHFIAPYCLPRANHSPKQGQDDDDGLDPDLSMEFNMLPPPINESHDAIMKEDVNYGGEILDNEFSFNCSPSSTMPTVAIDTADTSSLTNRTAQMISSTTNQPSVPIPAATSDDDYAESSETDNDDGHDLEAQQQMSNEQLPQLDDDHQMNDRKRKFSIFGKFIAEELISHATLDAEILYTRILSEVLNFRVRKQMRNAF